MERYYLKSLLGGNLDMFKRIIPSLLIKNNKLVKGRRFENHKNVGNPATTAKSLGAQNSDELLVINLDTYNKILPQDYEIIKQISNSTMTPLTYGGGVASIDEVKKIFSFGADKIYINSYLYENIELLNDISKLFGSQSIMAGVNIENIENNLKIWKKKNLDVFDWIKKLEDNGAGEIKITFVNSEGTSSGFKEKVCEKLLKSTNLPMIFEGGIGSLDQIKNAFNNGIDSIALGTMIFFKDYNIIKIKQFLKNEGFSIR